MATLLGIDYGTSRLGLAFADEETGLATPYEIIENNNAVIKKLDRLIEKRSVQTVVVGESKKHSGADNAVMKQIRSFVGALEKKVAVPVVYVPEFFTSAQARRQPEAGHHVDDSAAAIILQTYLETQNHDNE